MTSGERRLARGLLGALILGTCLGAGEAYAASPADVATARELYQQGSSALDAGNATAAVEKLSQAWALVQTPVIGASLALAQQRLGHLVEAREAALAVQRLPVAADETGRSKQARADADSIAAQVAPRIPHVQLSVQGVGEHHTATVKLDGAIVPDAALAVARQANPGDHKATLDTDDGRHAEAAVTLAEGDAKEVSLVVPPPTVPVTPAAQAPAPAAATAPEASPSQSAAPATSPSTSHISPLVWVGVVTGGVGLITGGITGALAVNEASIVSSHCKGTGTDGKGVCQPPYTGDLDRGNTYATVSTIGFVGVGVGAALAVTGWFFFSGKGDAPTQGRLVPFVGPVSGVAGSF